MWRNSVIVMFHSSSCVLKVCVIERSSSEWRPACLGCIIRLHTHSCQAAFPKLKTGGLGGPGGFSPAMFDPCFALDSNNNVDYKLGGAWWRNYAHTSVKQSVSGSTCDEKVTLKCCKYKMNTNKSNTNIIKYAKIAN